MEMVAKILYTIVGVLFLSLAYSLVTEGAENAVSGLMSGAYGLMKIITYYSVELLGRIGAIILFMALGLIIILNQFFPFKSIFSKK